MRVMVLILHTGYKVYVFDHRSFYVLVTANLPAVLLPRGVQSCLSLLALTMGVLELRMWLKLHLLHLVSKGTLTVTVVNTPQDGP